MIIARLVFTLETPLHCGGGKDQFLDLPVLRDSAGFYLIPGSSIAGIIRSEALKFDASENNEVSEILFGSNREDNQNASLFWCSDAHLLDFDGQCALSKYIKGRKVEIAEYKGPYIRDHVKIDEKTLTACPGGKYDEEIVPIGAKFSVEIKLDGWNKEIPQNVEDLFIKVMSKLMSESISFGGKQTNGYGKITFDSDSELRRFDLFNQNDMMSYVNLSSSPRFISTDRGQKIELPKYKHEAKNENSVSGTIEIKLSCTGPVMVSGSSDENSDADFTSMTVPSYIYGKSSSHMQSKPVIPGSSIKGVLYHRIQTIAKVKGLQNNCIEKIFGSIVGENAGIGRVRVYDMFYENSHKKQLIQHVSIDRFTGGALKGALFNEEPIWDANSAFTLKIDVNNMPLKEFGLLSFALLDLVQGDLPIGNGTNRGNGRFSIRKGLASDIDCLSCILSYQDKVVNIKDGKGDLDDAMSILKQIDEEFVDGTDKL